MVNKTAKPRISVSRKRMTVYTWQILYKIKTFFPDHKVQILMRRRKEGMGELINQKGHFQDKCLQLKIITKWLHMSHIPHNKLTNQSFLNFKYSTHFPSRDHGVVFACPSFSDSVPWRSCWWPHCEHQSLAGSASGFPSWSSFLGMDWLLPWSLLLTPFSEIKFILWRTFEKLYSTIIIIIIINTSLSTSLSPLNNCFILTIIITIRHFLILSLKYLW